jgi:hypothetical protein
MFKATVSRDFQPSGFFNKNIPPTSVAEQILCWSRSWSRIKIWIFKFEQYVKCRRRGIRAESFSRPEIALNMMRLRNTA